MWFYDQTYDSLFLGYQSMVCLAMLECWNTILLELLELKGECMKKLMLFVLFSLSIHQLMLGMRRVARVRPPVKRTLAASTILPQYRSVSSRPEEPNEFVQFDRQFQKWLSEQKPEMKHIVKQSDLLQRYQDHLKFYKQYPKDDFWKKYLEKKQKELMNLQQNSQEIIKFYQDAQQFDQEVKVWLSKQSKGVQKDFKNIVNGYQHSLGAYTRNPEHEFWKRSVSGWKHDIQEKMEVRLQIIRRFPYVIAAVYISMMMILLINKYLEVTKKERVDEETKKYMKQKYDAVPAVDHELLEVYEMILKALQLDPIPLYVAAKSKPNKQTVSAHYQSAEQLVCLFPGFFRGSKADQIAILFHELRHHMQYSQTTQIPKEVLEFAQKYVNQMETMSWNVTRGWIKSAKLEELDADTFAASKFSCPCCLKDLKSWGWNDPSHGYLMKEDYEPYIKRAEQQPEYCDAHAKTVRSFWSFAYWLDMFKPVKEPSYLDYLPPEMKRKAKEWKPKQPAYKPEDVWTL